MANKVLTLRSLDEVSVEEKIKELCAFSGLHGDLKLDSFCDVAAEVFMGVFQKIYPSEVSKTVRAKFKDLSNDPLLATMMMEESLEERIVDLMTSLKRILKRMYGSSTLDTCNVPRPQTAEGTPIRPGSANANKKENEKKKKKIKVPSSAEILRRSITGGSGRAGLVKRVLETTAASTLQHPKETLEKSIYRNAGHSLKILSQIDASAVVSGNPSAVGAMLGLLYQEYFRVVVMETPGNSVTGGANEVDDFKQEKGGMTLNIDVNTHPNGELHGPASPTRAKTPTQLAGQSRRASVSQQMRASASPSPGARRKGSIFIPGEIFKKDPRDPRMSTRMVPLRYQDDAKMREREATYIIGLDCVDPLKSFKKSELQEQIVEESKRRQSEIRSERRASRIIEMQQKWELQRIGNQKKAGAGNELETVREKGEEPGDDVHNIHACSSSKSSSDSDSEGDGKRGTVVRHENLSPQAKPKYTSRKKLAEETKKVRLPANLRASHYSKPSLGEKIRRMAKKRQKKVKMVKVNTRSCDTPNNPFVAHIIDFEVPELPPGDTLNPKETKRAKVKRAVEFQLRSVSPTGVRYLNPLDISQMDGPEQSKKASNHVKVPGTGRGRMSIMEKSVSGLYKPRKERGQSPPLAATAEDEEPEGNGKPAHHPEVQCASHEHRHIVHHPEDTTDSATHEHRHVHHYVEEAKSAGGEDDCGYDDEYGADDFEEESPVPPCNSTATISAPLMPPDSLDVAGGTLDDKPSQKIPAEASPSQKIPAEASLPQRSPDTPHKITRVRATSPSLYEPRKVLPESKYDAEVWGSQLKTVKRGQDEALRNVVDYDRRRRGFGLFMLSKLVHKTKDLPGFEATGTGTISGANKAQAKKGDNGSKRPQSASAHLGSGAAKKKRKSKKRGKSATRRRETDRVPDILSSSLDREREGYSFQESALELSKADCLSQAPSEDEEDEGARPRSVPHHRGPAMYDHHMPDRAYLEASMSFRVLGGELKELLQLPKSGSGKSLGSSHGSRRRPDSAPAARRGRMRGSHDAKEGREEEEDVFQRLYKEARILPEEADYTDPGYLQSLGFSKREIKELLSGLNIDTSTLDTKTVAVPSSGPGMARILSASDIPTLVGNEVGLVHYDEKTGRKSSITLREREEQAREWRRRIEVSDSDLDAFRLKDGKLDPPLDIDGNVQWAPVSSHPNLMGSPVKYMAEGSAAASTDYNELTSPQWPGYNTGVRTDEWVARQRREVRVEKFSKVDGRLVNHSQNVAIASYANLSEHLMREAVRSQEYRATVAQMEELDLVILVEHCQLCHLHSTTLRHKEEEYRDQANTYISLLLETAREAGIHARIGVGRYGTPVSALGPPPRSAAALQDKGYTSPGHEEDYSEDDYEDDTDNMVPSPGAQAPSPDRDSSCHDEHQGRAATEAGKDLKNAGKPLASLSPNLRGFMPQQRHGPPELHENTKKLTGSGKKAAPSRSPSPSPYSRFNPFAGVETSIEASGQQDGSSRRLGAFEIMVLFRPHFTQHGYEGGDGGDGSPTESKQSNPRSVKMELLHSKLASQKWPSRSVLTRRFRAFLGRYDVPGVTDKASSPDTSMAAIDITLAEYPDFHAKGPAGAMRVSTLSYQTKCGLKNMLMRTHIPSPLHLFLLRLHRQVHWLADSRANATRISYAEGESVWVRGLPHPRGGTERHHLLAKVHKVVTVDMSGAKLAQDGGETMSVTPKYSEDCVTVKAAQCLRLSSSQVPAPLTRVYKREDGLPLPLGVAIFQALPKHLQNPPTLSQSLERHGGESNNDDHTNLGEASGIWRVIHKLDRVGEGDEGVCLCRDSFFHQMRNLVHQVEADIAKKSNNKHESFQSGVVVTSGGNKVDLQLAYSEPVLNWLFGAPPGVGTKVARLKVEKEKLVNMGHLEALSVLQQRKFSIKNTSGTDIPTPEPSQAPSTRSSLSLPDKAAAAAEGQASESNDDTPRKSSPAYNKTIESDVAEYNVLTAQGVHSNALQEPSHSSHTEAMTSDQKANGDATEAIDEAHAAAGSDAVSTDVVDSTIAVADSVQRESARTSVPPPLDQAGRQTSTRSQVSASIANYLNDDESSKSDMSDSALMSQLMAGSSPSLAAKLEEAKEKAMEEGKDEGEKGTSDQLSTSAPRTRIVRDLGASMTPTSASPESSDDEQGEPSQAKEASHQGGHTGRSMQDAVQLLGGSVFESGEDEGDDDHDEEYGEDWD